MKTLIYSLFMGLLFGNMQIVAQEINYVIANEIVDLESREIDKTLIVGKSPSAHQVSPTGAFTYQFPIRIPQGSKGIEPIINLQYNSQSGNGIAGYGWGIEGLSMIQRVHRNHYFNDEAKGIRLLASDPLSWDGKRLILEQGSLGSDGAIYKTEAATQTEIRLKGNFGSGADWIEVEQKDGTIFEYGKTANSKVYSADGKHIIAWKINRKIDRFGNYIDYHYASFSGENLIQRISYTGNTELNRAPYVHVDFRYAERRDQNVQFSSEYGKVNPQNLLLQEIEIVYGDNMDSYKRYELIYAFNHVSLLNEIVEYGKLKSAEYYNGTQFSYERAGHYYTLNNTGIASGTNDYYPADYNGDGLTDLLRVARSLSNGTKTYLSYDLLIKSPTGFYQAHNLAMPGGRVLQLGLNTPIDINDGLLYVNTGDFNGDAKADFVFVHANKTPNNLHLSSYEIWYSECLGSNVNFSVQTYSAPYYNKVGFQNAIIQGDFDGDGADDLYCNLHDGHKRDFGQHIDNYYFPVIFTPNALVYPRKVLLMSQNENHSFSSRDKVYVLDLNGDGSTDIMQVYQHPDENITKIKSFDLLPSGNYGPEYLYIDDKQKQSFGNFPNIGLDIRVGDFNGDGKSDLLTSPLGDQNNWMLHLGTGRSFSFSNFLYLPVNTYGNHLVLSDFNGDGKTDILLSFENPTAGNTDLKLLYSQSYSPLTGFVFQEKTEQLPFRVTGVQSPFFMDTDGDGAQELVAYYTINDPIYIADFNLDNRYGLMNGVSSGFGQLVKIWHQSIAGEKSNCNGLYQKGNLAIYPLVDFQKALFVTAFTLEPDESGLLSNNAKVLRNFYYKEAKLHRKGKGFMGFKVMEYDEIHIADPNAPILFKQEEFDINQQYFFPIKTRAHTSLVRYDGYVPNITNPQLPCIAGRSIDKNLISIELDYLVKSLPNKRYAQQLLNEVYGDNLNGFVEKTNFQFQSANAVENNNPTGIYRVRAEGMPEEESELIELKYAQYGTIVPAAITERTSTKKRGSNSPFISRQEYTYYPTNGALQSINKIDPVNSTVLQETELVYNQSGLVKEEKQIVRNHNIPIRITTYEYDQNHRFLIKKTNPLAYVETWEYDDLSAQKIKYNDPIPNNGFAEFTYDDFHRLLDTKDEFGNLTTISRAFDVLNPGMQENPKASLYWEKSSSQDFGEEQIWYDHLRHNRKLKVKSWTATVNKLSDYNAFGQLEKAYLPFKDGQIGAYTKYEYDEFQRPILEEEVDANGTVQASIQINPMPHTGINQPYQYDNRNVQQDAIRSDGVSSSIISDASGKVIASIDAGGQVDYSYNSNEQLKSIAFNGIVLTEFSYDQLGNRVELNDLNAGKVKFQYNELGELTEQLFPSGERIHNCQYDALGRLIGKTTPDGLYEYKYNNSGDGIGQISEALAPNGYRYEYKYHETGKIAELNEIIDNEIYSNAYDYYSNGNLKQKDFPNNSQLSYRYNPVGDISEVKAINGTTSLYFKGYDKAATGNWVDYHVLGSQRVLKSVDDRGRLTHHDLANTYSKQYSYHRVSGNLSERYDAIWGNKESFVYDGVDRLKEVKLNGQPSMQIAYKDNGNIDHKSDIGNYSYHPSKLNALSNVDNSNAVIQKTTQDIDFDVFGNPKTIKEGNIELSFKYGPFHERKTMLQRDIQSGKIIRKVYTNSTEFLFDGSRELYEVDYIFGGDGLCALRVQEDDDPNKIKDYAVLTDRLGSVEMLLDENGVVVSEQSFDAWGASRDPLTWNRPINYKPILPDFLWRGYTGQEQLSVFQLHHLNGRLYDPFVGRVLSPDNFITQNGNSQGLNRYSYALNNPNKYTDPDGETILPAVIGGVFGAYSGGRIANQGEEDPLKWDYQDERTWKYMGAGAAVGAVSGQIGYKVVLSGIPLASTAGIATSSLLNSIGTFAYTGGSTEIGLSAGAVAYTITSNEFGYLGKKGNSNWENTAYAFGALANLPDIFSLIGNSGNVISNTAPVKKPGEWMSHASITSEDGAIAISVGPAWRGGINKYIDFLNPHKGGKSWATHANDVGTWSVKLYNVNTSMLTRMSQNIASGKGMFGLGQLKWNLAGFSCVNHASRSLWAVGVPTLPINFHPILLNLQLSVRQAGIYASPYMYQYK